MTLPTYRIRVAGDDDVEAILGLRRHAERWLKEAGIEQWTAADYGARVIKGWIGAGSTFAIESELGDVVGSLSLDRGDPDFWTADELAQPATYLYKFILRSDHRGLGLGDLLLDWACYRAELAGSLSLRLDCWRDNLGLHSYYRRRGFTHLDTRPHPVRKSGALFERPAELRTIHDPRVTLVDLTLEGEVFPAHSGGRLPVDGPRSSTTTAPEPTHTRLAERTDYSESERSSKSTAADRI